MAYPEALIGLGLLLFAMTVDELFGATGTPSWWRDVSLHVYKKIETSLSGLAWCVSCSLAA